MSPTMHSDLSFYMGSESNIYAENRANSDSLQEYLFGCYRKFALTFKVCECYDYASYGLFGDLICSLI
jgi:hypothetical protein